MNQIGCSKNSGQLDPRFEPHQCLCVNTLVTHAGCQEVSRHCKSENYVAHRWRSMQTRGSTLAFKSRAGTTRSLKQGCRWLHKKDWCPPKKFKKQKLPKIWTRTNGCNLWQTTNPHIGSPSFRLKVGWNTASSLYIARRRASSWSAEFVSSLSSNDSHAFSVSEQSTSPTQR